MQLDWERLFGRTRTLAIRFGLAAPSERGAFAFRQDDADFGIFELWAGGRCLTRNAHPSLGHYSDSVAWSLLDVASWLVDAWEAITTEIGFPFLVDGIPDGVEWSQESLTLVRADDIERHASPRFEWWAHHCLRSVAGVALPNVALRRVHNQVEVSWDNEESSIRPDIEWIERRGRAFIDIKSAAETLREAVVCLAAELNRTSSACQTRSADIFRKAESLGANPMEVAALLNTGLSDLEMDVAVEGRVLLMGPVSLAASGSTSRLTAEDRKRIKACVDSARTSAATTFPYEPVIPPSFQPWKSGYELATEFRASWHWNDSPAPQLKPFLENIGVAVDEKSFSSPDLHGFSLRGPSHRPSIWINRNSSRYGEHWTNQMLLAHELCHLLHDSTGETLSLLSVPWAEWPVEARANAFAAEVLMPRDGVAKRLQSEKVDASAVLTIVRDFGVGIDAALWHLKNLRYIDSDERVALALELNPRQHPPFTA